MLSLENYFLLDPAVAFLNHGSFGATPKPVFDEYQRWQRELENQPVEFLGRRFAGLMADSRAALGEYLGTHADNLVYTQNVTISLNIVARSLELGAGDEVLASDHEYGALDRTWRFLSKEHGFTYINQSVSLESKEAFIESFWAGVTPRTKIIFLSQITSPTAVIFPVAEIIQRAHAAGIITVIDGAHVAGQIPLHLDSLGADFYGGNLHKWLCAPKGAGFLYARPEAQHLLKPLVVSWGYESITPGSSQFVDHHEWWGTRDVAAFLSVPAAIQFQREHDWGQVRVACHEMVKDAQARVRGIGTCYCRHKMLHVGRNCDAPMNICMTFNGSAQALTRHGYARAVDVSEGMDLLQQAYERNLVQFGENARESVNFICNCCGCCCEAMIAARKFGILNPVHTSNFLPVVDQAACNGCGKCVNACPVEAMTLVSSNDPHHPKMKKAKVDEDVCLGCGVCARTCSHEGLALKSRPQRVITPLNSVHRTVMMAIERGYFHNLLFDNRALWNHRALAAVLGVVLRLPPVKQIMATQQVKSRYMEYLVTHLKV